MVASILRVSACFMLLLFVAGCAEPEAPTLPAPEGTADIVQESGAETAAIEPAASEPAPVAEGSSGSEISLSEIDGAGLKAAIAAHAGRVVLVDMWATWCIPCREKFPHIVELHRAHAGEGLTVISLSIDEPSEREAVLTFLTEQDAAFENFIGAYGLGTEATEAFEYGGEVPFYKLYDRQGALRYQFSGDPRDGIEPIDNMDQRIAELLAESA
jgi:thiol-disulfide isomerase/thioredoxin